MRDGYVKIHRSIWESENFSSEPYCQRSAFIWLVSSASWRDSTIRYKGARISLKRGQLAISIRDLADKWGWHRARVERFLARLKIETVIETANETGVTVITICNYNRFQSEEQQTETTNETVAETEPRHHRDTTETASPLTHCSESAISPLRREEVKKIGKKERLPYGSLKKESSSPSALTPDEAQSESASHSKPTNGQHRSRANVTDLDFDEFWNLYPRREGKAKAKQAYASVRKTISDSVIKRAVVRYAEWIQRNDESPQFIKHPTTWLNQGCWDDQLMDKRDRQQKSKTDAMREMWNRRNERKQSSGQTGYHPEDVDGVSLRIPRLQ